MAIGFYELKRALHFPQVAGFLRSKADVPYLYELLIHERTQSRQNAIEVDNILLHEGERKLAARARADWKMLDASYQHDIALCADFMLQNNLSPIG